MAGPAFWPSDGRKRAIEDAAHKIAMTMQTRITSATYSVRGASSNGRKGGFRRGTTTIRISKALTKSIIKGARVVSVWVDKKGVLTTGPPNSTYVLMAMAVR